MLGAQSAQPTQIMTGLALVVSMYHHQALDRVDLFHGVIAKTADDCLRWTHMLGGSFCHLPCAIPCVAPADMSMLLTKREAEEGS